MNTIEVENLSKGYGPRALSKKFWALQGVSFTASAGEILGVVGKNGAGKSTLLKCLSRITRPTMGIIRLRGKVSSLLEVGTGFHPDLSGRENIFLNGTIMGMTRREIQRKFAAIVDFAEIESSLDLPVKRYSSGMYVRLAFAVAAHLEPEILLVDEVLAVGDYTFQQKCLERTSIVADEGRTVIFVSHNLGAIHRLCSKTMYLEGGRLIEIGETKSVMEKYLANQTSANSRYEAPSNSEKSVQMRSVRLVDQNEKTVSSVRYHDPFTFVLDYEVNARVAGVSIGVGIGSIEYVPLFSSCDYDCDPKRLGYRDPGRYQARVTIPGEWLNTGKYMVQVYVANAATRSVFDRIDAFTFDVIDSGTPASFHGVNIRRGILQPRLPWQVERCEELER